MIRLAVILLAATATAAEAGPVVGFLQGFVATLAGNAVIGGTVAAAGFTTGVAAAAGISGTFLGRVALAIGVNAIAASLFRPRLPSPQDAMFNPSQPLAPMERVYGTVRKGGPQGFTNFKNNARHYTILLAAHPIDAVLTHYLDGEEVSIDGAGEVTTDPFTNRGRLRVYRGQAGQAVDSLLDSTFAEITTAFDFAGLSYVAIEARRVKPTKFSEVYKRGREWEYTAEIRGWDQIYDPRDGSTGWTDNAALILAHEILFHGKEVDWLLVAEEADACDVLVTNKDGGTQARWTINRTLNDLVTWEQARGELGIACDAFFWETPDGKVGFRVGRWIAPQITLTERDFIAISLAEKDWGPDVPGEAVVRYTEPDFGYVEAATGAIVAEAGLPRLTDDAFAADSHNQASRIAKRLLRKARPRYRVQATCKLIGYELIGQRFVRIALAELGLDATFEIDRLARNTDGITFAVELTSAESEDFLFDAATEEPDRPAREDATGDDTIPEVLDLGGTPISGGTGVAQIKWTWTLPDEEYTQVLRFRKSGDLDWEEIAAGEGQAALTVSGLIDGASYEAQVRNRTSGGRVGDWSSTVTVAAVAVQTVALSALTEPATLGHQRLVTGWRGKSVTADGDGFWWRDRATRDLVTNARYVAEFQTDDYQITTVEKARTDVLSLTRASAATYCDQDGLLKSAAVDVARFDWRPGVRTLLVEPTATNLLLHSEDITNAAWVKGGTTAAGNAAVAPDGATTMDRLTENSATSVHSVAQTVTITSGQQRCFSAWVKRDSGTRDVNINMFGGAGTDIVQARIDLETGLVVSTAVGGAGVHLSSGAENWGGGLWRIWLAGTMGTSTSLTCRINMIQDATTAAVTSYAGDGTSSLFLWGLQNEVGTAPTSYISTGAASATRSADVVSMQGITATLTVKATYGDGTDGTFSSVSVSPGYWPTLTQTRLRRLVGRTP